MTSPPTLAAVNALDRAAFVRLLGGIFEHSPWVAERAWAARPFADLGRLHAAMTQAVAQASRAEQLALLRAHPELAGREAVDGTLTDSSRTEQGRLGLTALSPGEFAAMVRRNAAYQARHGFPCIVAVRLHATKDGLFAEMERRLANPPATEIATALEQVGWIARFRLEALFGAPIPAKG